MVGYRIGEFDIVFYGDTAVVSFQADVDRLEGTEKSAQKLTFVDVYHKDPGGWIQVASNTSLHPDAVFEMASQRRVLDAGERASLMKRARPSGMPGSTATVTSVAEAAATRARHHRADPAPSGTLEVNAQRIARLRGLGRQAHAAGVSSGDGIQAYGNTAILSTLFYEMDLQSGGADPDRARDGDRGLRPQGRPVAEYRLATGAGRRNSRHVRLTIAARSTACARRRPG